MKIVLTKTGITDPTFNFTYPGTYRVVLEVNNSRGWDATAQEINVLAQPVANFSSNVTSDSIRK